MADSVAIAMSAQWKPLATTAVVCLAYSCWRNLLTLSSLSEVLLTSPGSAVCLLGLCFGWAGFGWAQTAMSSSGSSSNSSSKSKGKVALSKGLTAANQQQTGSSSQEQHSSSETATMEQLSMASSSSRPVRLAEPSADLSVPLGSNSRQLYSSTCKPRRRRLPRLSIELTPLPRLSVDFSSYRQVSGSSYSRASSIRRSLDRCSMMPTDASGMCDSSSWGISEELSSSGSGLVGCASLQLQQQLPTHAVGEVTDSLGLGQLSEGVGFIDDVINETHLLQVGAMMGESSARGALAAREAGGPVGHPSSFYGSADTLDHQEPWELLVSEGNDSVLYWGWRKPLRNGLYMYMTRSVFLGASPAELRAFMMDDAYRVVWDQSMTVLRPVVSPDSSAADAAGSSSGGSSNAAVELMAAAAAARMSASGDADGAAAQAQGVNSSSGKPAGQEVGVLPHESVVMQALVQFPKPMASRSYLYARRVWPRPADGGCYCLSKGCTLPLSTPLPTLPGRSVAVDDYCSGCVIRAPSPQLLPPGAGAAVPAAEVFMVYFEDSHVRAGLANLGIKKGLWPLVQRTEKALRVYQAGAAANMHLQAQPAADSRQGACSEGGISSSPQRPAVAGMSRSASLGACGVSVSRSSSPALSRSISLQEPEHTRRLSSASLPCFPLEQDLDDDEPLLQGPASSSMGACSHCSCSCSTQPAAGSSCCAGSGQQQEKQQKAKGSGWGWLGRMGSTVCGVIKQSGQLLAAASGVLWRSGPSVAWALPRFEWKVINWALQHVAGTRQLLLGGPAAAAGGAHSTRAGGKLSHVSSHPLREWAGPAVVAKLTTQVVRRLPSHPITTEELLAAAADEPAAIATVRSEPAMQLRMAYAAAAAGSSAGSCVSSTAGSDAASFSVSCSSCGCSCSASAGGNSSSGGSRRCQSAGGSSGGSLVRDETGGRRHRRVVVKLVQIAGLRVARRMARMAGISE